MKTTKILLALAVPAILVSCSKDPELPYELEETIHSFAVSAAKSTAHDLLLNAGSTDGDFYVKLDVPKYMGDYSSYFKEAQLLCVYTPASGGVSSAIAAEGITTFPTEVKIDMPALCSKLGIASPKIGDKMQFATNIIHKDGTVVPGWTSTMGFNNRQPTILSMADGSDFSYCATFIAAAPLQTAYYNGGNTVVMTGYDDYIEDEASQDVTVTKLATIPAEVIKSGFTGEDYIGLEIGFDYLGLNAPAKFQLFINKKDYSVSAPSQDAASAYEGWVYSVYGEAGSLVFENFSGELDTQTNKLTFSVLCRWYIEGGDYDGYSLTWGNIDFVIDFSDIVG
ncbi:MAG: hypothetical protein IKS24_01295 [Bacteroidaceae bacterium]|nr:hypothetical protein [Bacteroidaceae bacterium]